MSGAEADSAWRAAQALVDGHAGAGQSGQLVEFRSGSRPRLPVWVYVPESVPEEPRVLVSVHGVSRNAEEHVALFRQLADRYGAVVVAPTFDAERFRDYQRLGRMSKGPRADLALIRSLNEIGIRTGWNTSKVDLFGFSGGAQFAHRFTFAHPQRVRRLVLGAAGWYTMPDAAAPYPHGVADAAGLDNARFNLVAAVQLRTLVVVGARDNKVDDMELNRSARICRQQGFSRLERAHSWVNAMNAFARQRGVAGGVELAEMDDVEHSFREAVLKGDLATKVFEFCYG